LDLVHYYRLHLSDPEKHTEINKILTGPMSEEEKPPMQTEAAKKLRVPSWWQGPTTISDATMAVAKMREKP
jgi:hypothetical protein